MRLISVILLSISFGLVSAQKLDHHSIDLLKLERELLQEINALRASKSLQQLEKDSSLTLAANDQARYIAKLQRLTHRQPTVEKAKARNRMEYYGGKMRAVGENTAYIKLFQPAIYKAENGRLDTLSIDRYEQARYYFLQAWLNSEAHRTNLLYNQYEYTGLKIVYDRRSKTLYAVQVFGFGKL